MKIIINDVPVKIISKLSKTTYDIHLGEKNYILLDKLKGKVLIEKKNNKSIDKLLKVMTGKKYGKIKKIDVLVNDKKKTIQYLKSIFNIVEAAGGIVEKEGKLLLIFRRKKWDIAKGKLEKGEKKKEGAVREVEEETGVKVAISDKICTTWHTYIRNKKYVLKKTYWYKMTCLDDTQMKPQEEEEIEDVRWMTKSEVKNAMKNTFVTIESVVKKYYNSQLAKTLLNNNQA